MKIYYEGKLNKNFAESLDFCTPDGQYNQVAYLFSDANRVSIRIGTYARVEGLTLPKFYSGTSMPRNREIMRIFKDLELVEQLGSGVPKIVEKYGRKAISISGRVMQTTLRFDRNIGDKNTSITVEKTVEKMLNIIANNPQITQRELTEKMGLTRRGVEWNLSKLKTKGLIERVGADKGGHWKISS